MKKKVIDSHWYYWVSTHTLTHKIWIFLAEKKVFFCWKKSVMSSFSSWSSSSSRTFTTLCFNEKQRHNDQKRKSWQLANIWVQNVMEEVAIKNDQMNGTFNEKKNPICSKHIHTLKRCSLFRTNNICQITNQPTNHQYTSNTRNNNNNNNNNNIPSGVLSNNN